MNRKIVTGGRRHKFNPQQSNRRKFNRKEMNVPTPDNFFPKKSETAPAKAEPTKDEETEPKKGQYWVPKMTKPHYFVTKKGYSKNEEWLQQEGTPVKVIKVNDDSIELNSFHSAENHTFKISIFDFKQDFFRAKENEDYLDLPSYPFPIAKKEFEKRKKNDEFKSSLKKLSKDQNICKNVRNFISVKLPQLIAASGAKYITINSYHQYQRGEVHFSNRHKRYGHPIFNRTSRWCPPVDISYDEFKESLSYPAPIGIHPKDFCLPSESIETLKELINQGMNFANVKESTFLYVQKKLDFVEKRECHTCRYCGEVVDMNKCVFVKDNNGNIETYKSSENYIEICHRDPNGRFLKDNIYFGHGDCNGRQGGFSEKERMKDGIQLLYLNSIITKEQRDIILYSSI
jgi:hypothetical protein